MGVAGIGTCGGAGARGRPHHARPLRSSPTPPSTCARTRDLAGGSTRRATTNSAALRAASTRCSEALERSLGAQRQLVADASHELRTPLTSLRTNIEVLARADGMPDDERERAAGDHDAPARGAQPPSGGPGGPRPRQRAAEDRAEAVRLDLLVSDAVERARRRNPVGRSRPRSSRRSSRGAGSAPPGGGEPARQRGEVEPARRARSRCPRATEADGAGPWPGHRRRRTSPRVFDRFYRAPAARGLPGSGLGLAIVRQVRRHITAAR